MSREFKLLLAIILTLASSAGYLYLSGEIAIGEMKVADGQRRHERGQSGLVKGKARLEAGKQELSDGKKEYRRAKGNLFLVVMDKLLKGGKGFRGAKERIAEGERRVAEGEDRIAAGEKRVEAGELKLRQGKERLKRVKVARAACALGAAFFALASITLGFSWRRSLTWRLSSASG